jgi:peptide/nickel transport system permease protein
MNRYVVRRALHTLPILLGVTIVVFVTIKLVPGNAVTDFTGPNAPLSVQHALAKRLGLERPIWVQYFSWLGNALKGNLGISIAQQEPVWGLLIDAFKNTAILGGFAAVVSTLLGGALGVLGAFRSRTARVTRLSSALSTVALSIPQYSLAIVMIVYLALYPGWFPVSGMYKTGGGGTLDLAHHLILPGVTCALVPMGIIAKQFSVALRDVLDQGFIESLRARGLSEARVFTHALHNTLPSLLTIAGLQIGYLLGGVVFVETVFAWPGIGLLVYQAISERDLPVIQAGVLFCAFAFVLLNFLVDIVHAAVDPRVRSA